MSSGRARRPKIAVKSDKGPPANTLSDSANSLATQGFSSEELDAYRLAKEAQVEFIRLSESDLSTNVVRILPQWLVTEHNVIAVEFKDNTLYVALTNPWDLPTLDQINLVTQFNVKPLVATQRDITQAINQYYGAKQITRQGYVDAQVDGTSSLDNTRVVEKLAISDKDGQIVRLVNSIIKDAIDSGASDIHVEPENNNLIVRMRIDGILRDSLTIPANMHRATISRLKVLADMDITEKRHAQDGHIQLGYNKSTYDLRVSILPTVEGEKTVIRVLDKNRLATSLSTLNLAEDEYERVKSTVDRPHGMVLVTGPTGSGKTTTLYALLKSIDSVEKNIITIENPVEYRLERINQVQIAPDSGDSFSGALRAILRQDPDVIMVGEIRDPETAEIAVQAALTGHLVLSTLHTNDAATAITRMIDLGIPSYLLASCVVMSIAQRLLRKVCPECREAYRPDKTILKQLGLSRSRKTFYHGRGCRNCLDSGYRGREAAFEILPVTPDIQMAIAQGKNACEIKQLAQAQGMRALIENGLLKAFSGHTTVDEVRRVIPAEFM